MIMVTIVTEIVIDTMMVIIETGHTGKDKGDMIITGPKYSQLCIDVDTVIEMEQI